MKKYKSLKIGILLAFVYFVINLAIINDYGISWDYHFHNYAGRHLLGLSVPSINDPSPVPFTPPDPRVTINDPFGPIMSIVPVLSEVLLNEKFQILPFDSAYNLPSIIYGSLGVGILFIFLYEALGFGVALTSSLFLGLLPNYFGYVHTNMKDIPVAVLYALSIYLFWRLANQPRIRNLILAAVAFGLAFNIKINAITIPVVNLLWFIGIRGIRRIRDGQTFLPLLYFLIAPLFAVLIWWPFWTDPLAKLLELPRTFSVNTYNIPVLFFGNIYKSGVNIPFFYPYVYLAVTTPLSILISFLAGLIVTIIRVRKGIHLLLLLWFFVPLLRFFDPHVSVIDGVRHFMEVVFPMCAIAGVGAMRIYGIIGKIRIIRDIRVIGVIILLVALTKNIVDYHPYETSYFNSLVGGIKGAQGKFDIDFWGTPQREAILWLNINAPVNSYINVAMAQASAGMYAREDLRKLLNKKNIWDSDYVVVLNRQSFWSAETISYMQMNEGKKIYKKTIDNIPLVWIYTR